MTCKGYVCRILLPSRRSCSNPAQRELGDDGLISLESMALNQEILVLIAPGRAFTVPVAGIPLSTVDILPDLKAGDSYCA